MRETNRQPMDRAPTTQTGSAIPTPMRETRKDAMTKDDIEVANHWTDAGGDWAGLTPRQQDDARSFARRIRATPPAAETGEPVAWGVFSPNGRFLESFENERAAKREASMLRADTGDSFGVKPLYAAPPPREVSEAMRLRDLVWPDGHLGSCPASTNLPTDGPDDTMWCDCGLERFDAALSAETGTP